jgi:hypothetical protein
MKAATPLVARRRKYLTLDGTWEAQPPDRKRVMTTVIATCIILYRTTRDRMNASYCIVRAALSLIALQKSLCTGDQKFCGLQVRLSCKDVGTAPPHHKLTGDLGNAIPFTVWFFAENSWPATSTFATQSL